MNTIPIEVLQAIAYDYRLRLTYHSNDNIERHYAKVKESIKEYRAAHRQHLKYKAELYNLGDYLKKHGIDLENINESLDRIIESQKQTRPE